MSDDNVIQFPSRKARAEIGVFDGTPYEDVYEFAQDVVECVMCDIVEVFGADFADKVQRQDIALLVLGVVSAVKRVQGLNSSSHAIADRIALLMPNQEEPTPDADH